MNSYILNELKAVMNVFADFLKYFRGFFGEKGGVKN